jgi:peptidoglycan/LPS O-acetylase OafA/YrhL
MHGHNKVGVAPSSGPRLAGIEGLRAIAAFAILVHHVWISSAPDGKAIDVGQLDRLLPDLAFGVTLFFTLSGFLLYHPFAVGIMRQERLPSISKYLRNRALRIVPAYWVILLATAVFLQSVLVRDSMGALHDGGILDAQEFLRNALFLQHYSPRTVATGIGPAWSLAIEVVFYLALPLLALLSSALARTAAARVGRRVAALAPAALMLLIGLSGKAAATFLVPPVRPYAGWEADWHSVLERSFWCQADLFAFGMALAVLHIDFEDRLVALPRGWRKAAAVSALLAYLLTAKMTHEVEQLSYSPYNTLMAFACALLLALVVLPADREAQPPALVRLLDTRAFVVLGLMSYSIFLWHDPLIRWLRDHGLTLGGATGFFVNLGVASVITLALATLTYRYVEAPALRLKRRTVPKPMRGPPVREADASGTRQNGERPSTALASRMTPTHRDDT